MLISFSKLLKQINESEKNEFKRYIEKINDFIVLFVFFEKCLIFDTKSDLFMLILFFMLFRMIFMLFHKTPILRLSILGQYMGFCDEQVVENIQTMERTYIAHNALSTALGDNSRFGLAF